MTTNQIIAAVRRKILEATSDVVADDTLLLYANEAWKDLYRRVFPNATVQSASVAFVNGIGTLPATFGTMYGDAIENPSSFYAEVTIGDYIRADASNVITVDAGVLKISPLASKTLTVRFYPSYGSLSATTDPTLDSYFDEMVIYGTMYRVYEDLQDEELSTYYEDKYEKKLKLKKQIASNYEDGNQRGGQMFNGFEIVSDDSPYADSGGPNGF